MSSHTGARRRISRRGIIRSSTSSLVLALLLGSAFADKAWSQTASSGAGRASFAQSLAERNTSAETDRGGEAQLAKGDEAAIDNVLPPSPRVLTELEVPLILNGRFQGMVTVAVDSSGGGAVAIPGLMRLLEKSLSEDALRSIRSRLGNEQQSAFEAFGGDLMTLRFATASLELIASAAPSTLRTESLSLTGERSAPDLSAFPPPAPVSIGVNLSATQRHREGGGLAPLFGAADLSMRVGGVDGFALVTGADYDQANNRDKWRRRETRLIRDYFQSAIRVSVGEFSPTTDGFQGSGRLLGVGIERAYSTIRPFQNIRPSGRQSFSLEREAEVDVEVNGLIVQTLRLAPGRYELRNFPYVSGSNRVRLLANDFLGRREVAVFDAFSGSELLGRNVIDFGVSLGLKESRAPLVYGGAPLLGAHFRRGVSETLTAGMNFQSSGDISQLGGVALFGGRIGSLLVEAAASHTSDSGRIGLAGSISYRGNFSLIAPEDFWFTVSSERYGSAFRDPFQPNSEPFQAWRTSALAQWTSSSGLGLSVAVDLTDGFGDTPRQRQLDIGVSKSFGRASLVGNVSISDTGFGKREERFTVGLVVPFKGRWSGQARFDSRNRRSEAIISRYPTGALGDISGDIRLVRDRLADDLSGRLRFAHNRFEAELLHNRRYDQSAAGRQQSESALTMSTFIGYADRAVGIGRPTDDAFIIAPIHSSLSKSRVTLTSGSVPVARSGFLGPPLLPIRRAYGPAYFDIEADPLPAGYDLGASELRVFPPTGAGFKIQIGSDESRTAIGVLTTPEGPVSLATGTVERLDDKRPISRPFFTNRSGRFVAERLSPGGYRVIIDGAEVSRFEIPEALEGIVNVGSLAIAQ
jgi:outer membrane usher protein FimD/PapC